MSLMKALKYVDENFDSICNAKNANKMIDIQNTKMTVCFFKHKPASVQIQWLPHDDKYCLHFDIAERNKFTLNTWDLHNNTHTWNEDLEVGFDIERSYFDCLNTIYPMTTNFKFEHLKVLNSIAEQYCNMIDRFISEAN